MLTLAAVLTILVYGLMSPLLGVMLPTYALKPEQQGSVAFANAVGLVIASLCAGPFVDWKGKKPALLIGLSLVAGALIAAPNLNRFPFLLTAYFALGLGGGSIVTAANSLVGEIAPTRRASALNFLNLFFGLGGIVTTFAASYLLSSITLCYSVAALVMVALLVDVVVKMPAPSSHLQFKLSQLPGLLSNPILLLISLLLFLYVACEVSVWNWLKTYLISIHFAASVAGGVISYGFALGMLLGRFAASRILIRVPPAKLITLCGTLIAVTTFAMLRVSSQAAVTFAVLGAGLAMAPVFPTALSLVGDHFQQSNATAMGIAITSGWLGLAVSSPIVGIMAERSTLQHALLILPALAAAIVLVSMVLNIRLLKTQRT